MIWLVLGLWVCSSLMFGFAMWAKPLPSRAVADGVDPVERHA